MGAQKDCLNNSPVPNKKLHFTEKSGTERSHLVLIIKGRE